MVVLVEGATARLPARQDSYVNRSIREGGIEMNERDKELANQVTWYADVTLTELSRYADLIRADEREACADAVVQAVEKGLQAAIAMEREACAKVCDERTKYWQRDDSRRDEDKQCAAAIRARGNT